MSPMGNLHSSRHGICCSTARLSASHAQLPLQNKKDKGKTYLWLSELSYLCQNCFYNPLKAEESPTHFWRRCTVELASGSQACPNTCRTAPMCRQCGRNNPHAAEVQLPKAAKVPKVSQHVFKCQKNHRPAIL